MSGLPVPPTIGSGAEFGNSGRYELGEDHVFEQRDAKSRISR